MRSVGGKETNRNVLVDGNNLIRRVYHAFIEKDQNIGPDKIGLTLLKETLYLLTSWLHDIKSPTKVILFLDGSPSRRLSLDPEYKKTAKRKPVDLGGGIALKDGSYFEDSVSLIKYVFLKLGCDVCYGPHEEADDLIASFTSQNPDSINIVISSDKDFFQLVSPRTILYRPGATPHRFYDSERVSEYFQEKFGFPLKPSQVRMFKTLTGDSSDNIPGIPRLRKSAAVRLYEIESIDELSKSGFPGLSATERSKCTDGIHRIALNWDLVGLHYDLDLAAHTEKSDADFKLAKKICNDNGIDLDTSVFRIGVNSKAPTPTVDSPVEQPSKYLQSFSW
jgi:5'-3' exonuclease